MFFFCDITVMDSDINNVTKTLPVIIYLAGYCAHVVLKNIQCNICKEKLVQNREMIVENNFDLIKTCDRGGLYYPAEAMTNAVLHTYIFVQKLISEKYEAKFLRARNQRNLVMKLVKDALISKEMLNTFDCCSNGHFF